MSREKYYSPKILRRIDVIIAEKGIFDGNITTEIPMCFHQSKDWPHFTYNAEALIAPLAQVRAAQGYLLGKLHYLGFDLQTDASLTNMALELVRSAQIEGEILNLEEVRSSIARRLGLEHAALVPASRYVDGVVELMLNATQLYDQPLTSERLFGWHAGLFPFGYSGSHKIEVAKYRTGEMQVVSGAMGHERVHYEAPAANRVEQEMSLFLDWINTSEKHDPIIKAAIAHLWFVTIHPFDDGNGRIARAITDMLLARAEGTSLRFYSMSVAVKQMQKEYYNVLERTQRGGADITEWLLWFLQCLDSAIKVSEISTNDIMRKASFWRKNSQLPLNERQRKMINKLFDGFYGVLTTSKWAKMCHCSSDTALNDINDLVKKGIMQRDTAGGRSTNYVLKE